MRRPILPAIATVAVLLALGPDPVPLYLLLRFALCLIFVLAYGNLRSDAPLHHRVLLAAFAVVYNPAMPVHLGSRGAWSLVNIVAAIYLWVVCLRFGGEGKTGVCTPSA